MEDLTGQTPATAIDDTEWNTGLYQELKNFITLWQVMSQADAFQLNKGINNAASTFNYYSCGGPVNVYALSVIGGKPPPSQLIDGMEIRFRPNLANTGAVTVNLTSLGAADVRREDGVTVLQANDFVTGRDVHLRYDGAGAKWLLHVPYMGSNPMTVLPKQYREGLTMGRATVGLDPKGNQDVVLAVGSCRSQDNSADIVIPTAIRKRFDASFGVGDGAGGWPATLGARAADTHYPFFVIANTVSGEVDAGWDDTSDLAATTLIIDANTAHATGGVGEWVYRQLGWIKTTGTNTEFVPFRNDPTHPYLFMYAGGENAGIDIDQQAIANGNAAVTLTLADSPPNVMALVGTFLDNTSGSNDPLVFGWLTDVDHDTAVNASFTSCNFYAEPRSGDRRDNVGPIPVRIDASQQCVLKTNATASGAVASLIVLGFHFRTV